MKFPLLVCHKPDKTSWETTSQFQSHSMVRDIFIWNYRSLLLWRRERAVTVTGPRYVHMLENFLGPELPRHPVTEETFSQQDGATSHTARDSMAAVRNLSPNHVISRYGDVTWPATSPDLSAWFLSLGLSEISSLQSSSTPHSSGVETSNSVRSQGNSSGDSSKSNGWRSQETCRVPRAEWWSSEWFYFQEVGLLFSMC